MSQTQSHKSDRTKPAHADDGQMRAGVYRGEGPRGRRALPIPEIGEGEVLFRVAACGICGTDIKKIQHGFIEAAADSGPRTGRHGGEDRTRRDEVQGRATAWSAFTTSPAARASIARRNFFPSARDTRKTGLTAGFDPSGGGFAEYVRAMPWIVERGMIALPPDVTFEEATFVEPVNTCLKAVRKARVAAGETVLVIGQGPIGMLLVILAKHRRRHASTPATRWPGGARQAFDSARRKRSIPPKTNLGDGDAPPHRADAARMRYCWLRPMRHWCPRLWLSRGRAGACYCLLITTRCCSWTFPAAAVGIEEKEILGSYSASVDDQEESAALGFQRRVAAARADFAPLSARAIADALELAAHPKHDTLKVMITHE